MQTYKTTILISVAIPQKAENRSIYKLLGISPMNAILYCRQCLLLLYLKKPAIGNTLDADQLVNGK